MKLTRPFSVLQFGRQSGSVESFSYTEANKKAAVHWYVTTRDRARGRKKPLIWRNSRAHDPAFSTVPYRDENTLFDYLENPST